MQEICASEQQFMQWLTTQCIIRTTFVTKGFWQTSEKRTVCNECKPLFLHLGHGCIFTLEAKITVLGDDFLKWPYIARQVSMDIISGTLMVKVNESSNPKPVTSRPCKSSSPKYSWIMKLSRIYNSVTLISFLIVLTIFWLVSLRDLSKLVSKPWKDTLEMLTLMTYLFFYLIFFSKWYI